MTRVQLTKNADHGRHQNCAFHVLILESPIWPCACMPPLPRERLSGKMWIRPAIEASGALAKVLKLASRRSEIWAVHLLGKPA